METRICKDCKDRLPLGRFATYKRKGEVKYMYRCLDCHRIVSRERQRRYIAENREAHNKRIRDAKRKRYRTDAEHREKMKDESSLYYYENRDKVLEKKREDYAEDGEAKREAERERYHRDDFKPKILHGRDEPTFDDVFSDLRSGVSRGDG